MNAPKRNIIALIAVVIACLLLSDCMFRDLKQDIKEEKISFRLYGRIENMAQTQGHVYVLLYVQEGDKMQLDRFILPDDDGTYAFLITPGTYIVAGFEDRNNNHRHDLGEPAGAWGSPNRIVITGVVQKETVDKTLANYDFDLTPGPFRLDNVVVSVADNANLASSLVMLGQPATWDDPLFDQKNADTGFWKPITFVKQQGLGIYFLEAFDPNKIPIVFVHGAAGTPRAWKFLAEGLDRDRFQVWVYYYPSGLRLGLLSTALNNIINRMQIDYGFEQMGVVAHSMGGLVSRSFILKHMVGQGKGTVKVFVSLSTPWGGVATAAKGVEHAPEAIPSWYDVAPESDFLKRIYADSLRPAVPHYLIFGYRGDCSLFMANNDGTVEVSSELDVRAQDDAVFVRGLNEDHMSILESRKALDYLNDALESNL